MELEVINVQGVNFENCVCAFRRRVCSVQKAVTQPVKTLQSYCKPALKPYTQPCLDNKSCNGVR
jgi:hypothetical protein